LDWVIDGAGFPVSRPNKNAPEDSSGACRRP
jgi:hypothetical protein